ncbi:MAG: sulfate/molybdate ABC transporter ATP-binding protein [Gammaproteobacteria bacterium]|nr:sulfate/molybdate ABC transporter ATP-binding protein [Gammaproteobacteria bacterium]
MDIQIRNIHKQFAGFPALDDVSLAVGSGELIALLGPSGSGKTTLLRIIAGLEFPDRGQILFGGEDMSRRAVRERNIGFVFQHYALFKHMTVLDNIAFGLTVRRKALRPAPAAIRAKALELLELVQLGGLEQRYPHQLSGGQKQRVALARALAIDPRVLLLDEPFGALDAKVRKDLRRWLRELHQQTGYTTVFVTHDQEEALELADRVVIMNRGRIEQVGTVDDVYETPRTPFVFDFLGDSNVLDAEVRGRELRLPGAGEALVTDSIHPAGPVDLYVRPGDLRLAEPGKTGIDVRITEVQRTGPIVRASADLVANDSVVSIELPHLHHDAPAFRVGAQLRLRLMQFSVYPAARGSQTGPTQTPVREREPGQRGRG